MNNFTIKRYQHIRERQLWCYWQRPLFINSCVNNPVINAMQLPDAEFIPIADIIINNGDIYNKYIYNKYIYVPNNNIITIKN